MPWHDVLKRRYLFYQNGKYFILASPSTCGFNVFVTATCYEPKLLYFGQGPLTTQCTWPQVLHAPWRARILARPRLCHPRARERGPSPGSRLKFNQTLWDRISPSCDRVQCSLTLRKEPVQAAAISTAPRPTPLIKRYYTNYDDFFVCRYSQHGTRNRVSRHWDRVRPELTRAHWRATW